MDVSVIIPTRDRLWSMQRAVESCRSSVIRVQIIVVDDGSTDGTAEWLDTQPDVEVVNGEGWGKPWGVNRALSLVSGTYLRFLDSDDWLAPGANEAQFASAEESQAELVVSGVDVYYDETLIARQPWLPTDDFIARQLGVVDGSHYSAFLFRTASVRDIPHRTLFPASDFGSRDDRCFVLEVALREPKIAVSPGQALCRRHHSRGRLTEARGGLRADGADLQQIYIYRQILGMLEARDALTPTRKYAAARILWQLASRLTRSRPKEVGEVIEWVQTLDPEWLAVSSPRLAWLFRRFGFRFADRVLRIRGALIR